jgi:hypothetical protein
VDAGRADLGDHRALHYPITAIGYRDADLPSWFWLDSLLMHAAQQGGAPAPERSRESAIKSEVSSRRPSTPDCPPSSARLEIGTHRLWMN